MKKLIVVFAMISTNTFAQPLAKIENQTLNHLKHDRIDPYFWMNKRDQKEVVEYLEAENNYSKAYFDNVQNTVDELLNEFENRIDPNEQNAPFVLNNQRFQQRNVAGKDYEVIYLLNGEKEQVYFDENERAKNKSFYSLADWAPSPNNEILAFSEDFIGRRNYTLKFRNNTKNTYFKDEIQNTDGSMVWANDNKTVFYVKKDPQTLREYQVYKHILGTNETKDQLVYQEDDERFSVFIGKSTSKKYILIHAQSSTTNEIRIIDANIPESKPNVFLKRKAGHLYDLEHHTNGFYILSNENAVNNAILFSKEIPVQTSDMTTIYAHDSKIYLDRFMALKNYLVIQQRINGLMVIEMYDIRDKSKKTIAYNEEAYYAGFLPSDDFDTDIIQFVYNSLTVPSTYYNYDISEDKREKYFEKKLIDPNFNSEDYQSERIWALANDGTEIPICLVYKKGTVLSKAPLLLYGYGSYGVTIPDVFSATRISLLDRGFVYAIAHIRGSKYMGEEWYQAGKFLKKKNTFTDFINCAEWMAQKSYCDPEKIFAQGGSAGGLLMGAIANMAPYMFKGIVAQVPFVDVVSTMLDESIPLTVGEYEEWGNPNEQKFYDYMLSYSPYDNIKKMDYPAMFITTGYHDSQVQYWEPAKWVAKLRAMKTDNNILLFDCNMDAGHGGGSGRSTERLEVAKEFAFILSNL